MLLTSINKSLGELINLLDQLSMKEYSNSCPELSGASIGEHTRHIIEMFQCLENQYESGTINYDLRNRDYGIQTDIALAKESIVAVLDQLDHSDKKVQLQQVVDGEELLIGSNYYRELLYNLEHCIHHQALIKVAVLSLKHIQIDENFGVARSTIEYRKKCAQ